MQKLNHSFTLWEISEFAMLSNVPQGEELKQDNTYPARIMPCTEMFSSLLSSVIFWGHLPSLAKENQNIFIKCQEPHLVTVTTSLHYLPLSPLLHISQFPISTSVSQFIPLHAAIYQQYLPYVGNPAEYVLYIFHCNMAEADLGLINTDRFGVNIP